MRKHLTAVIALLLSAQLRANAIRVFDLTVNHNDSTVTFKLEWQNGWHLSYNYDAAWVFVKFRRCYETGVWSHGLIDTSITKHSFGGLEPVWTLRGPRLGTVGIDTFPYNTGVMLRIRGRGVFATVGPHTITLKLMNLPKPDPNDPDDSYDVSVFAIEMVYIPTGPYWNLHAYSRNSGVYVDSPGDKSFSVYYMCTYPERFTAYWGFHLAKYEISQGQYADFLNHLPNGAAANRFSLANFNLNRNRLQIGGLGFYSDRPDRAQNYISVLDFLAYCDWAALRPATALEYIKAARGSAYPPDPNSTPEYAWGTEAPVAGTHFNGAENGTEEFSTPSNANCTFNNVTYTGGDGGRGPARVGIHAKPGTSDRARSGAGAYGNLDLSGNLAEFYLRMGGPSGYNYADFGRLMPGDGILDANGDYNEDWPRNAANNLTWEARGGAWSTTNTDLLRITYNSVVAINANDVNGNTRWSDRGGRPAR